MKRGLIDLLECSATVLERYAEEIRISHTNLGTGRWPAAAAEAKRDWREACDLAKGLRQAHRYHKPNPLGGPARMFDVMADRIRAGEPVNDVVEDFGLKMKRRKS